MLFLFNFTPIMTLFALVLSFPADWLSVHRQGQVYYLLIYSLSCHRFNIISHKNHSTTIKHLKIEDPEIVLNVCSIFVQVISCNYFEIHIKQLDPITKVYQTASKLRWTIRVCYNLFMYSFICKTFHDLSSILFFFLYLEIKHGLP